MDPSSIAKIVKEISNQEEFLNDLNDDKYRLLKTNYPNEWIDLQQTYQSDASRVRQQVLTEFSNLLTSIQTLEDEIKEKDKKLIALEKDAEYNKRMPKLGFIPMSLVCLFGCSGVVILVLMSFYSIDSESYRIAIGDFIQILGGLKGLINCKI